MLEFNTPIYYDEWKSAICPKCQTILKKDHLSKQHMSSECDKCRILFHLDWDDIDHYDLKQITVEVNRWDMVVVFSSEETYASNDYSYEHLPRTKIPLSFSSFLTTPIDTIGELVQKCQLIS